MTEQQARALLPDLSSPDANRRRNAAQALGVPGWTFAVADLMRLAASDPDLGVRVAAIRALAAIGDRSAYALLERIWKNPSEPGYIRCEALDACDQLDGMDQGDNNPGSGGGGSSPEPDNPWGF